MDGDERMVLKGIERQLERIADALEMNAIDRQAGNARVILSSKPTFLSKQEESNIEAAYRAASKLVGKLFIRITDRGNK